jgi:hypothetical protein
MGRLTAAGDSGVSSARSQSVRRPALLWALLFVIVTAGLLLGLVPLFSEPCQEMIGITSTQSWVPVYVLYDPPGNGSYAELSRGGSGQMTIRFDGTTAGHEVIGGYTGAVVMATFVTHDNLRWHGVVAVELNQTWEVWQCSSGNVDWIEARLVSCEGHGVGFFAATELEGSNIWIDNLTGTSSPHRYEWSLAQGETIEATFSYSRAGFFQVGAGYNVSLLGFDFSVRVWLNVGECSLVTSYVFSNSDGPLNLTVLSSGPITQLSEESFDIDGLLLWFDK